MRSSTQAKRQRLMIETDSDDAETIPVVPSFVTTQLPDTLSVLWNGKHVFDVKNVSLLKKLAQRWRISINDRLIPDGAPAAFRNQTRQQLSGELVFPSTYAWNPCVVALWMQTHDAVATVLSERRASINRRRECMARILRCSNVMWRLTEILASRFSEQVCEKLTTTHTTVQTRELLDSGCWLLVIKLALPQLFTRIDGMTQNGMGVLDEHVQQREYGNMVSDVQQLFVATVNLPDVVHQTKCNECLTSTAPIEDRVRAWPEFQLMEKLLTSR
jgi:hypothetical protein